MTVPAPLRVVAKHHELDPVQTVGEESHWSAEIVGSRLRHSVLDVLRNQVVGTSNVDQNLAGAFVRAISTCKSPPTRTNRPLTSGILPKWVNPLFFLLFYGR